MLRVMGALGRSTGSDRGRLSLVLAAGGAGLLAAFSSAALAHGAIDLAGQLAAGGDAYAGRDHVAVGPVALIIAALLVAALGSAALGALARHGERDPVRRVARRLAGIGPLVAVAVLGVLGLATLLGMEFTEQLVAVGHVVGVADALGGTPLLGLAIVFACATLVALAGRQCAAWLVEATVHAVLVVAEWLRAARAAPPRVDAACRTRRRPRVIHPAFLARCSGLRAPPSAA
jgi:hypothetical protein